MGKTLGQREEWMVEDCTGRTQAKNKSQTTLKNPRTSPLPREVLILTRSTFVVSQASTSGVLQKFSKASDRVIPTFVAQPPCCWGCHGCLQQLTPLDTAGHTCWDSTRNVQITLGEYFEKHSIFEGKICLASMCWWKKKKENISTGVTSPNLIFRAGDKPRGAMGPMAEDVWELTRAPLWAAAWQESCFTKAWVSEKLDPLQFKEENVLRAPKSTLLKYIFIFLFPPKRGSCSAASALLHGTLGREGSAALHSSTR